MFLRALNSHPQRYAPQLGEGHAWLAPRESRHRTGSAWQRAGAKQHAHQRFVQGFLAGGHVGGTGALYAAQVLTKPADWLLGTHRLRARDKASPAFAGASLNHLARRPVDDVGVVGLALRAGVDLLGLAAWSSCFVVVLGAALVVTSRPKDDNDEQVKRAAMLKVALGVATATRDGMHHLLIPLVQVCSVLLAVPCVAVKAVAYALGALIGLPLVGVAAGLKLAFSSPVAIAGASDASGTPTASDAQTLEKVRRFETLSKTEALVPMQNPITLSCGHIMDAGDLKLREKSARLHRKRAKVDSAAHFETCPCCDKRFTTKVATAKPNLDMAALLASHATHFADGAARATPQAIRAFARSSGEGLDQVLRKHAEQGVFALHPRPPTDSSTPLSSKAAPGAAAVYRDPEPMGTSVWVGAAAAVLWGSLAFIALGHRPR